MTIIYPLPPTDQTPVRRPVHVLIIGVGWYGTYVEGGKYKDGSLPELRGVGKSAYRTAMWWIDQKEKLVDRQLGSVDMLLSCRRESVNLSGSKVPPLERATFENVKKAFERWINTCSKDPESIGILHWIGHGQAEIIERDPSINGIALFCEDLHVPTGQPLGISWSKTIFGLRRMSFAERAFCFIDACRSSDGVSNNYESALPLTPQNSPVKTEVFSFGLPSPGVSTFCRETNDTRCGFGGGAIVTESILDGLSKFAADLSEEDERWYVSPTSLLRAINTRLSWWAPILKFDSEVLVDMDPKTGSDFMVEVTQPECMVKVRFRKKAKYRNANIYIVRAKGAQCDHDRGERKTTFQHDGTWRTELPQGEWCAVGEVNPSIFEKIEEVHRWFETNPPMSEEVFQW